LSGFIGQRDWPGLLRILSFLLALVALAMLAPLALAFFYGEAPLVRVFALTMSAALALTLPWFIFYRKKKVQFSVPEGFLLVTLAWFLTCLLGAFPYYFSGTLPKFIDALFESCSGFSTTGATIIADVESMPRSLLFWRGLTHWLGGMGIVVLTVAILPLFGVDGIQLVKAESSGAGNEKLSPRITSNAKTLWLLYIGLTALQAILLKAGGMGWFDAVFHAFSTMSSGGFSTRNNSIAAWNSPWIERVCLVFMILAAFNFNLLWRLLRGKFLEVFYNSEARAYIFVILLSGLLCGASVYNAGSAADGAMPVVPGGVVPAASLTVEQSVRQALFQSVSLLSTTGFAVTDHTLWPPLAQTVLFFIMFLGGCSSSTTGGIKLVRYVVLFKQTGNEMKKLLNPRGVFAIRLNNRVGRKDVVYGVAGFVFLYMALVSVTGLILCVCGLDIFSSINLSLLTQGNIGLGLGTGDFGPLIHRLPPFVKAWLCFVMIAGRLELLTICGALGGAAGAFHPGATGAFHPAFALKRAVFTQGRRQ
jgi:trk system potassium uptake protein TrkH